MRRAASLALSALFLLLALPLRAEPLRLLVESAFAPRHTPLFLAVERGYFAAEGIEPTIEPGLGANMVAVLVSQRGFDMGQVPASIAAASIAGGVPIRMIAVYQPRSPAALVGIKGRVALTGPASLDGLRLGMTPGGVDGMLLAMFRRANAAALTGMLVMPMEQGAKLPDLIAGRLDVVLGDALAMRAQLHAAGQEAVTMELADHGVPLQGLGFVAGNGFLAARPEVARRTLAAIRRGMEAAAADPAASCATARAKAVLEENAQQCAEKLAAFLAQTMPANAPGWGRQSPEAWARMIEVMRAAGEIQGTRPSSYYFTNSVIP